MSIEALRAELAATDSSANPAGFLASGIALANELGKLGQRPGGFPDNERAVALLDSLSYLLLLHRDPALDLAWHKACFYAKGDRYEGDRELNLREAIGHAERALELLRAQLTPNEEAIGAFLNDMANCYLRANCQGSWPLEQAAARYREGLALVSPERFPRLHSMLTGNLAYTEQLLAQGRTALPEHETARRFDFDIQRAVQSKDLPRAVGVVWAYLQWAWSLPTEPNIHLVSAYTQLANLYGAMGHAAESLPHIYCAIALCTSIEKPNPTWQALLRQAQSVLEQVLGALKQEHKLLELSTSARGSFSAAREAWQAGNQFLTKNPAQAFQAYEHALQLFPLWPAGLHARGLTHLLLGNPQAAIQDFTSSLQFLPNHPKTLLGRSKAHSLAGNTELAAADLAEARKYDPTIPESFTNKAGSGA